MVKLKIDTWCNRRKARVNMSDQSFAIGVSRALDWLREFSWPIRARSKDKLVQSTQHNATLFRYMCKEHFILISTLEKKVNFADPVKDVYIRSLKTLLCDIFDTFSLPVHLKMYWYLVRKHRLITHLLHLIPFWRQCLLYRQTDNNEAFSSQQRLHKQDLKYEIIEMWYLLLSFN